MWYVHLQGEHLVPMICIQVFCCKAKHVFSDLRLAHGLRDSGTHRCTTVFKALCFHREPNEGHSRSPLANHKDRSCKVHPTLTPQFDKSNIPRTWNMENVFKWKSRNLGLANRALWCNIILFLMTFSVTIITRGQILLWHSYITFDLTSVKWSRYMLHLDTDKQNSESSIICCIGLDPDGDSGRHSHHFLGV